MSTPPWLRVLVPLVLTPLFCAPEATGQIPDPPEARVVEVGDVSIDLERGFIAKAEISARSVGFWFEEVAGQVPVVVELIDGQGQVLSAHSLVVQPDLAPAVVGSDRPAGERSVSALMHTYSDPIEALRITAGRDVTLQKLAVVWIAAPVIGAQPTPPVHLTQGTGTVPKPFVYDRASWGASAPTCTQSYCNVTHLALHHSASTSDYAATTWAQAAANVKAIQVFHQVSNGWCDVGYNYLVSKQGWIFEGRAGGDDVKGAHDGFNCGSMAACGLGFFHPPFANSPTSGLLGAVTDLFAWKASQKGIDPLGSSFYAGLGATEANVYGHRDVKATACPGDGLYAELPGLRAAIASTLNGGSGGTGLLKGVLYNAALGTSARIQGGTVALSDGSVAVSDNLGYYEFAVGAGTHSVGATAPGFEMAWGSDTVPAGGEVWESLGLLAKSAPTFQVTPTGSNSFNATFTGPGGSSLFLAYSLAAGLPPASHPSGLIWPSLNGLSVLSLGSLPGSGSISYGFTTPALPGLVLHMQALSWTPLGSSLSNGRAFSIQ